VTEVRVRVLLPLALCSACSVGVIPRDVPPPEPTPEPAAPAEPGAPAAAAPAEPAPAAQPEAQREYKLDGNRLELPGPIAFQTRSDQLDPASDPALEHVRSYLADKDYVTLVRVEGHADDQVLSEKRAVAVGRWLIAHGVDCKRLIAVGFGPTKPVADAQTPEGRAQNTRVEVHNAALRGRNIGGASPDGGGQVASADLCH
jgi:OOP family OmpA-OmpF porin